MNNLKVLMTAVTLLLATPVLAQEMGGATGPGSASGLEPTYTNGYDHGGHLRAGGGALDGNNSYAMSPGSGDCALRYRSYDPASGTYVGHDGRRHSCQ
jgi:BA14K-like protein